MKPGTKVKVHYTGTLNDGSVFAEGHRTRELSRNTPLEKILSATQFGDLVAEKITVS